MGDTTRLKRVREFIADQTGHPLGEITLSTRLVEDGGVDGDDAVELMEAFMEDFHVEMSDFRFKQHFGPEAGDPLLGVFLGVAITTSLAYFWLIPLWVVVGYGAFQWIKQRTAQSGPGTIRKLGDVLELQE